MATPAWERRNAAAAALGYGTPTRTPYYDYRVHGFGKRAPGTPIEESDRPRLRGHRGAKDLVSFAKPGADVVYAGAERDPKTGRFKWVEIVVIAPDGTERTFRLRGKDASRAKLKALLGAIEAGGANVGPVRAYLEIGGDTGDAGEQESEAAAEREELEG